jgi:hypothetical protein
MSFGIVAVVQLFHYVPRACFLAEKSRIPVWESLTKSGEYFPIFAYWFECLGFLPIFAFVVSWFFMGRQLARFYLPSVLICFYTSFHKLQPYDRHSVLVFFPLWISLASIAVIRTFQRWSKAKNEQLAGVFLGISIALYCSFIFSGLLGVMRLFNNNRQMWSQSDDELAQWVVKNTPRKAVFIACNGLFSPVFALAGKVQHAHDSHTAWLLGYDTRVRVQEMASLLEHPTDATLSPKIIYIVNNEKKCPALQLQNASTSGWELVFETGNYTVYKRPS